MFPILFLAMASSAWASFQKGPFLQHVTQSSIIVSFELDAPSTASVAYGVGGSLSSSLTDGLKVSFHEIRIEGLSPGTLYDYEVTAGSERSSRATFMTAPRDEQPFNFVVVGDTRTDHDAHQGVMDQIVASVGHPDLYFNTGDLVESGDDPELWNTFFEIEHDLFDGSPFFPLSGNHDDVENDSYFTQFFNLPEESSGYESYYAFTYGNSRFVILDTEDDYVFGSEQNDWLEAELAASSANPSIQHIFCLFHDPPYTSGAHGVFDAEDWQNPRTYLVPLFSRYGVEAVFNGHDHHYERSDPSQTDGVTYVVTGGGGAPGSAGDFVEGLDDILAYLGLDVGETLGEYYEVNEFWLGPLLDLFGFDIEYEGGWWRADAEVMKHFVYVEIAGGYLEATVFRDDGTIFETWTSGVYDPLEVDDDGDGFTENENDCDDANASTNPEMGDECDGIDNDCDGVDEGCDTGGEDTEKDTEEPGEDTASKKPKDDVPPGDTDVKGDKVEGEKGCGCASTQGRSTGFGVLMLCALLAARRRSGEHDDTVDALVSTTTDKRGIPVTKRT